MRKPLPRPAPPSFLDAPSPQPSSQDDVTIRNLPRNFLHDQAAIWTSPKDLRAHDLKWLIPLAAATGVALGTDHYVMTQVVSKNPSFNQANINASNAMVYSLVAAPVVLYGFGRFRQGDVRITPAKPASLLPRPWSTVWLWSRA